MNNDGEMNRAHALPETVNIFFKFADNFFVHCFLF